MDILKLLGISPEVIVANILSFLILLWLLSKVMVKPLAGILNQRKDEIEDSYRRITEENARIEQTQMELNRRLEEIEAEARTRIEQATVEATRLKEEILSEARTQADKVKQRGIEDIEREREKALQSIREHVADLVAQASEKIIGQSMTADSQRDLITRTLDQLESSKN